MRRRLIVAFLTASAIASACNRAGRQAAWEVAVENPPVGTSSVAPNVTAIAALEAQAEADWKNRDDRAAVMKAIEAWERVVAEGPKNPDALIRLSRAYYFFADAYLSLESRDDNTDLQTFEKGVNAGEKALLQLEPEFEKKMRENPDAFEDAIATIGARGVPAAYWYCANIGRFATRKGLQAVIFYKARVEQVMLRVIELQEDYFHAGPQRLLGVLYAAVPSMAGKDFNKSREHFDRARTLAPEYLSTWVVEAQFLAVQLEDKAMYQQLLKTVLNAPEGDDPEIVPENRAAKRAAEKLLKEINDQF